MVLAETTRFSFFSLITIGLCCAACSAASADSNSANSPQSQTLEFLKNLNETRFEHLAAEDLDRIGILNLSGTAITDEGLKKLSILTSLVTLNLGDSAVTDEGLKELSSLSALTSLTLRRLPVTGRGLKALSSLRSLVYLDLSFTHVTGEDLSALSTLPSLKKLMLWNVEVTDEDLKSLSSLSSLTTVYLGNSKVTREGVELFNQALPRCKIHEPRLAEPTVEPSQEPNPPGPERPFRQGLGGQTITKSVTLTEDILDCEGDGIFVAADGVVLDCGGHTISGLSKGNGITSIDRQDVTIRNCVIRGFENGIHLASKVSSSRQEMSAFRSRGNLIEKSTLTRNDHGVFLLASRHDRITRNRILDNRDSGIVLQGSRTTDAPGPSDVTIRGNLISGNRRGISFHNPKRLPRGHVVEENIFRQNTTAVTDRFLGEEAVRYRANTFGDNMNTLFFQFHGDHHLTPGKAKRFQVSIHNSDGSPATDVRIKSIVSTPKEVVAHTLKANRIQCEFTPRRKGLYSITVHLKGSEQKSISQRYWFGSKRSKRVYLGMGSRSDVGFLLDEPPDENVNVYCTMWVEGHFKAKAPESGIAKLTGAHVALWTHHNHEASSKAGTVYFLEFDGSYSRRGDVFVDLSEQAVSSVFKSDVRFGKGVFLYEASDWNTLNLKWNSIDPVWTSDPVDPSVVTFHYLVTDAPAIESVSNRQVQVLSATTPGGTNGEAEIVVMGYGETQIVVQRPEASVSEFVEFDGVSCEDSSECRVERIGDSVQLTVNLSGTHEIRIGKNS